MTPTEFCYWLQGYFELNDLERQPSLSPAQLRMVRDHLQLVFSKATPACQGVSDTPTFCWPNLLHSGSC